MVVFNVNDFVFLKASPMHNVTHFSIKGKLAPRYIGLFEITEKIGDICLSLESTIIVEPCS